MPSRELTRAHPSPTARDPILLREHCQHTEPGPAELLPGPTLLTVICSLRTGSLARKLWVRPGQGCLESQGWRQRATKAGKGQRGSKAGGREMPLPPCHLRRVGDAVGKGRGQGGIGSGWPHTEPP